MSNIQGTERSSSSVPGRSAAELRRALQVRDAQLRVLRQRLAQSERRLEEERTARGALEAAHERISGVLECITNGFFSLDREWRFTYLNREWERIFGRARDGLLGQVIWEEFPGAAGSIFHREYHRAMAEQQPVAFEAESTQLPGRWFEVRAYPSPTGLSIHFHDITDRRRAEAAQCFLAEAGSILASSLDYETTLASVTRLAVSGLADWCFVDIVEEDGCLRRVATAHRDPRKEALTRELLRYPPEPDGPNASSQVLRSGKPLLLPTIDKASLAAMSHHSEHLRVLRALRLRSGIVVPLIARGRTIGVLALAANGSGRRYGPEDLPLAEELARRAALAVDNAWLYRQAQQAIRAREQVLRVVSHDLRNPLIAVFAHADLLLHTLFPGADEQPERRWLETIRVAADQMHRLLRDLVDVAGIEAGRLAVEPERCASRTLAGEALRMLRPLAARHSLRLAEELPEGECPVLADPDRILQVLSNLLGNAIKFTPAGGEITLRVEPGEEEVRFTVSDSGAGIPLEELPHLFEPFWKGSNSGGEGTGLGLAIVRGIVEAHGGRIGVESRVGEGSSFHFTLPVANELAEEER